MSSYFKISALVLMFFSVFMVSYPSAQVANQLTPSNVLLDSGQFATYNVLITGANVPFTANLVAANGVVVNTIVSSTNGIITFNSFAPPVGSGTSDTFNVVVTDSTPTTFNSVSNTIAVSAALGTPTQPTVSNTAVDSGQEETLVTNVIGGTTPYTYNFIISNSLSASNIITSSGSQSSNTFTYTTSAEGTFLANVIVTDSATTNEITTSGYTSNIAIKADPRIVTFTPSNVALDAGQTASYSIALDNNGFGPFTIELYNATGGARQASNALISAPRGSNTIAFTAGAAGIFSFNAIATDLGVNSLYTFNSPTNTIAVYNTPTISINTSKISLSAGGSVVFRANIPANVGAGPFAVNLIIGPSVIANAVIPANGGNFTYQYAFGSAGVFGTKFTAVDRGTSTPFAFNSSTVLISVGSPAGGGGGSSGGGGPQAPTVQNTTNGYNATGVAQLNTFTLDNLCGKTFHITDNFITPNYTGVTIGTSTYNLYLDVPQLIAGTTTCYAKVTSISYLPILVSVNFLFYNTALNATRTIDLFGSTVHTNVNTSNTTAVNLNINSGSLLLSLLSSRSARENVTIENLTTLPVLPPANFTTARAISISITSNSTPKPTTKVHLVERYNCTIPSSRLLPYILVNGIWQEITPYFVNATACTFTYNITVDPVLALFESSTPISTTSIPLTSATTTTAPATTSIPFSQQPPITDYVVAVVVVLAILVVIYEYIRRKGDIPRLRS